MAEFVELPVLVDTVSGEPRREARLVNPDHVAAILPGSEGAPTCTVMIAGRDWRVDMPAAALRAGLSCELRHGSRHGTLREIDPPILGVGGTVVSPGLTAIKGIGDKTAALLESAGIRSVTALAALPLDDEGRPDLVLPYLLCRLGGEPDAAQRAAKAIADGNLIAKARSYAKKGGLIDLARRAAGAFKGAKA